MRLSTSTVCGRPLTPSVIVLWGERACGGIELQFRDGGIGSGLVTAKPALTPRHIT
jgi:hypothetical protein